MAPRSRIAPAPPPPRIGRSSTVTVIHRGRPSALTAPGFPETSPPGLATRPEDSSPDRLRYFTASGSHGPPSCSTRAPTAAFGPSFDRTGDVQSYALRACPPGRINDFISAFRRSALNSSHHSSPAHVISVIRSGPSLRIRNDRRRNVSTNIEEGSFWTMVNTEATAFRQAAPERDNANRALHSSFRIRQSSDARSVLGDP